MLGESQADALIVLLGSPGVTHGELASRLAFSKSNVSRMVARMEQSVAAMRAR
jgi:DNA-binding MarR family transcriptional regulator